MGAAPAMPWGWVMYGLSTPSETGLVYVGLDINDGGTAGGWLKNVPSSRDSRKSLQYCWISMFPVRGCDGEETQCPRTSDIERACVRT